MERHQCWISLHVTGAGLKKQSLWGKFFKNRQSWCNFGQFWLLVTVIAGGQIRSQSSEFAAVVRGCPVLVLTCMLVNTKGAQGEGTALCLSHTDTLVPDCGVGLTDSSQGCRYTAWYGWGQRRWSSKFCAMWCVFCVRPSLEQLNTDQWYFIEITGLQNQVVGLHLIRADRSFTTGFLYADCAYLRVCVFSPRHESLLYKPLLKIWNSFRWGKENGWKFLQIGRCLRWLRVRNGDDAGRVWCLNLA